MSNMLIERAREPGDDVISASAAAEVVGHSRQAVDKGLRDGRIPGFRDPDARKMWVEREWVLRNAQGGPRLLARMDDIEAQVRDQASALQRDNTSLRVEVTTAKELNLRLLAAADARDKADKLTEQAVELDDAAKTKRRKAAKAARRAARFYREAISQTQLPGSIADLADPTNPD